MPYLFSFLFGTGTRALLTSAGIGTTGFIFGVKTSDALAVAAGVATFWYLNKRAS